MNQLFAAICEQHPGFEVMDVRLLANQNDVNNQDPADLDCQFAEAVRSADQIDIAG